MESVRIDPTFTRHRATDVPSSVRFGMLRPVRHIAAAGALALSIVPAASAQLTIGGNTGFLRTDANVVSQELARHLPASGVRSQTRYVGGLRWETTHTLTLTAETTRGLSTRTWRSDTRAWTEWLHHGNPLNAPIQRLSGSGDTAGIDMGLTTMPGYGAGGTDWIAYQGVGLAPTSPTVELDFKTGIHQIEPLVQPLVAGQSVPSFSTVASPTLPASYLHFNPQAGVISQSPIATSRFIRHVFGTGVPRGFVKSSRFAGAEIPLVELRREHDSAPQWINHGHPNGVTGIAVGPGSATRIIHNYLSAPAAVDREEQRYVFVATNPAEDGYGEGLNGDRIFYLRSNSQGNAWNGLGSPGSFVYGAPLAIPYYTNIPIAGGLGRIVVFAVARNGSGAYVLKSRFHDGNGWDADWQNWGAPGALGGDKFKLTSAVVWYDGAPNQMANLRINAFGYSEEVNGKVGQLIEFFWDGATWRFASPRTAPDGQTFRTSHSTVVDEGARDRIVVVGRTSTGRVYEFAREIESGVVVSERWTDLSFETLTLTRVGP